jgi:hypothetical protein
VAHEPITSLIFYHEADPAAQAAYVEGLRARLDQDGTPLDGNPAAWHCTVCDVTTPGEDILISEMPTPIPYCPGTASSGRICTAYGPALKPVTA